MLQTIYLDYNATTPVDRRVLEAMLPYFADIFGNAASVQHVFGQRALAAVEEARGLAASIIGAQPREVVFTSGATESNNLAIKGVAHYYGRQGGRGRHVVTCCMEHSCVLESCGALEQEGFEVTYLRPREGSGGVFTVDQVAEVLRDDTLLVSVMWSNNELGTINDIPGIGRLCKAKGVLFHTDATQYVGKLPVDVAQARVDLLSWSGHKMYGPKGVGALYVRAQDPRVRLQPILDGGGHERAFRSGTLNVPGIVGFGKACEIAQQEMALESVRLGVLRDRLEQGLLNRIEGTSVNGDVTRRLPHVTNMCFGQVDTERLMLSVPEVAVSAASACTAAGARSSHVLKCLGLADLKIHTCLRMSVGRATTAEQVDYVVDRFAQTAIPAPV